MDESLKSSFLIRRTHLFWSLASVSVPGCSLAWIDQRNIFGFMLIVHTYI